jgi:hypothetical protein
VTNELSPILPFSCICIGNGISHHQLLPSLSGSKTSIKSKPTKVIILLPSNDPNFKTTMRLSAALLLVWASQSAAFQVPKSSSTRAGPLFAKFKVFIDGEAGTTGLQVRQRLEKRDDLQVISPPFDLRKDESTRKKMINEADVVILCKQTKNYFMGMSSNTF